MTASRLLEQWLGWYVVVQVLGLLGVPLAWTVLHRLPDRGYSAGKSLAILLHGLVLWLGTSYGVLRNELGGAVLAAVVVGGASVRWGGPALRGGDGGPPLWRWCRERWSVLAAEEAVFLIGFAGWAVVRAYSPAADHTEQPMDLLFLSGIRASPTFPAHDPWLAGYAISYYSLGHWMLSALGLLAGLAPEITYNLGQACWYGLLLLGSFGMGFNLAALDRPSSLRSALAAGALAALAVGVAGNPQGTLDALQRRGLDLSALARGRSAHNFEAPSEQWWWWRSSRVLEDRGPDGGHLEVIDEFPAFSYVIGDDHPHMLAMPFALVVLALALNLFLASRDGPVSAVRELTSGSVGLGLLVACVGALVFLNTWDFPAQWLLIVASAFAAARGGIPLGRTPPWRPAFRLGAALAVGSAALCVPFLLCAQSQVEGIRLNRLHGTPLVQLLLMFAPQLAGLACLAAAAARVSRGSRTLAAALALLVPGLLVLAVAALGRRGGEGMPSLMVLGALLACVSVFLFETWSGPSPKALPFALLLAAVGLLLLLGPEMLYVEDGFGTRMNTVFKLYYQAWLLLGLAGVYGIVAAWRDGRRVAAAMAAGLTGLGLLYTAAAVHSVTGGFRSQAPTFDALAYLADSSPDERAAIDWVRRHTPPTAVVVQGVGRSYAAEEDRLSVATGRATLLGWEGHELQWRGRAFGAMSEGRREALDVLYQRGGEAEVARTLADWKIDYVFVGPAERRRYGMDAEREARLRRAMDLAFAQGEVRIYRRRSGLSGS